MGEAAWNGGNREMKRLETFHHVEMCQLKNLQLKTVTLAPCFPEPVHGELGCILKREGPSFPHNKGVGSSPTQPYLPQRVFHSLALWENVANLVVCMTIPLSIRRKFQKL